MAIFRKKPTHAPNVDPPDTSPPVVPPAAPRIEWDLAQLVRRIREAAPALEAKELALALLQARLADHYRDLGLMPPNAEEIQRQLLALDVESQRRLALAVSMLDDDLLRAPLAALATSIQVAVQVEDGFLGLAQDTAPLTVSLIRQSAVRAEEFGRHLANRLGVAIAGESDSESRMRLYSLDYKRLLAEAEQAKEAAQDKMERLRKKQLEADQAKPRGKW